MNCNCNNTKNYLIQITAGTTFSATVVFDEDISDYTSALFTIRANYDVEPVINKTFEITDETSININLTKAETALFTDFEEGKSRATYIWGLDLADDNGVQINVFPQTGNTAPTCFVWKHVVETD